MESEVRIDHALWPYSAWVPTVNGRLSFRHIGDTAYPVRATYANRVGEGDVRYIVVRQRRNLSDAVLPAIVDRLSGRSGAFDFVIVARTDGPTSDNGASIEGVIHIHPVQPRPRFWFGASSRAEPGEASAKVEEAIGKMNDKRSYRPPPCPGIEFEGIRNYLEASRQISVAFKLARDGVVRMKRPEFGDAELAERSRKQAGVIGVDFDRYLAEQAYFFLRDIAHAHQHHAPQTDTLIGLQDTDSQDHEWRDRILFALHHHIVAQRRSREPAALVHALGVVAYIRSFRSLSARSPGAPALVQFDHEALAASLSATIRASEIETRHRDRRRAQRRELRIWSSVFIISAVAIFVQPRLAREESGFYPILHWVSHLAASHAFWLMLLAFLVPLIKSHLQNTKKIDTYPNSMRNDFRLPLYFYPVPVAFIYGMLGFAILAIVLAAVVFLAAPLVESLKELLAGWRRSR